MVTIVLLILLGVVGFGIWYGFQFTTQLDEPVDAQLPGTYVPFAEEGIARTQSQLSADDTAFLSGRLFFSSEPAGSERLFPYTFDLATQTLTRGDRTGEQVSTLHSISPDGRLIGLIGTTREHFEEANGNEDTAMQVYVYPYDQQSPMPEIGSAAEAQSRATLAFKRSLSVGNDGRVLYGGHSVEGAVAASALASVNNWHIYLSDPNGEDTLLVSGMYPHWISASEFLFLRQDGVHVYDFETGTHTLALAGPEGVTLTPDIKLSVSDDARFAALVDPADSAVYVLRLARTQDGTVAVSYSDVTIPVAAGWAVFSPDSRTLAVQEVSLDGSGFIAFYDVQTGTRHAYTITLADFMQQELFVTDWR